MSDNNQQIATRQPSAFEAELQSYEPQFAAALPSHISPEKFRRTVITALNAQPDLMNADRRSLFTACVRAAQDGLFPDGREAALVVFNSKDRRTGEWRKQVQYMPMVSGLIKRMRNSGELAAISAYVVFSNDAFDYALGDEPHVTHKPALGDRGQPIAVYAIAKLTNGEVLREIMSVQEIDKVRAVSRAADSGPWVAWWEEMARKSCIRRLAKRLPGSADIDDMMRREEEQYRQQPRPEMMSVVPLRPTRDQFMREQVQAHLAASSLSEPAHDLETGEIEEEPDRVTASEQSLLDQGDIKCEEGIASLEAWWRALSSAQRGELGAKGRSSGQYMQGWKIRAQAADERGGPEPEEPEETGSAPPLPPHPADVEEARAAEVRRQRAMIDEPLTPPDVPLLWKRDDGTADWTRWAGEMVGALRTVSDKEVLAQLRAVRDTHADSCPMHVMMDLDRADKEAAKRVAGESYIRVARTAPRF